MFDMIMFNQAGDPGEFRRSGLGIAERQRRFEKEWQPHLEACRRVEREWAAGLAPEARESLVVLGAGRLFDFEKRLITAGGVNPGIAPFRRTTLVDVDSTCLPYWEKCRRDFSGGSPLHFELIEITGRVASWNIALQEALGRISHKSHEVRWRAALEAIGSIGRGASSLDSANSETLKRILPCEPTSVLSLNLLSQLPLSWQRIVEGELIRSFGSRFVEQHEGDWLSAYRVGADTILRGHAALLCSLGVNSILLISDIDYLHSANPILLPSLERLQWQSEPESAGTFGVLRPGSGRYFLGSNDAAGGIDIADALAGSGLFDSELLKGNFPGFSLEYAESWLWHIAPRCGRREPRPEVHRVAALRFGSE